MATPVGRYTFREVDRKLQFQPRTLNDLKHREHFEKAAQAAQDVKSEVEDTYQHLLSLDQTEHDFNKRPGEVLVKDHAYGGVKVSGSAFLSGYPGFEGGEVMNAKVKGNGSHAALRYTLKPDRDYSSIHRVIEPFTQSQVSEHLTSGSYVRDGVTDYSVSTGPQADPNFRALTQTPYQKDDIPSFARETVEEYTFTMEEDRIAFQPRKLEELGGFERRQELLQLGNDTRDLVTSIYKGVLALDGTSADLNPKAGEVLFQEANLEGRTLSGFLSESQVRDGDTREKSYGDLSAYLVAVSKESEEVFTARVPGLKEQAGDSPRFPHSSEKSNVSYGHENGERLVQVDFLHHPFTEQTYATVSVNETPKPKETKSWWQKLFS